MRRPDVFTLDQAHPLAQGLVTAWMGRFSGVARSFDEVTGTSAAIVGNAGWSDIFGRAGVYAKALGAAIIVPRAAISASDTHTISWCINARGSSYNTGTAAFGRHFEDANMSFNFYNTGGNQFQFAAFGISAAIPLADSIYNVPTVFSLVVGPSNARLFKDGNQVFLQAGTKLSAPAANTYLLNRADLGRTCNAGIADFLIHNRGLSSAELALLANVYDPMLGGLIVEDRPVLYYDMGGSTEVEGPAVITAAFTIAASGSKQAEGPATVTASASVGMGGVKGAVAPLNIVGTLSVEASGIKSASSPATITTASAYGASGIKTIAGLDKEGPAVITASSTVGMGGAKGGVGAAVLGADSAVEAGGVKGAAGQAWFAAMGEFYAVRGPDDVPIAADEIGRAVSLQARNYSAVLAKRNYTARL
jgi:hypothetical protein